MFLRQHHRSKDGKEHGYWSLVETVRTPDGPRQRTICYLGELNDSAQARWQKTIRHDESSSTQHLLSRVFLLRCRACVREAVYTIDQVIGGWPGHKNLGRFWVPHTPVLRVGSWVKSRKFTLTTS